MYKRVIAFLAVLFILIAVFPALSADMPEEIVRALPYNVPHVWQSLGVEKGIAALDLLVSSVEYNLQSISTIKAEYNVDMTLLLDETYLNSIKKVSETFDNNVYRHRRYSVKVASDRQENKTYRDINYLENITEYNGNEVDIDDAIVVDVTSVDTPTEHIFLEDGELKVGLKEAPALPSVDINQIARITPPEDSENKSHEAFIDPFEPYYMAMWGNLGYILKVLEGKEGNDERRKTADLISVEEANDQSGNKWFRYRQRSTNGNDLYIVWGEPSGFLPVCNIYVNQDSRPINTYFVQWSNSKGIYVPAEIFLQSFLRDGVLFLQRKMVTAHVDVNETLAADQFTLQALGLQEGGLVVDNIHKKIFKYKQGKPVFFAKFHSKQKEPRKIMAVHKTRVAIVVLGMTMIAVGFFLRRCPRKKEGINGS